MAKRAKGKSSSQGPRVTSLPRTAFNCRCMSCRQMDSEIPARKHRTSVTGQLSERITAHRMLRDIEGSVRRNHSRRFLPPHWTDGPGACKIEPASPLVCSLEFSKTLNQRISLAVAVESKEPRAECRRAGKKQKDRKDDAEEQYRYPSGSRGSRLKMSSLSRRACYKCGNVGHYAEVCSSSERLCYNCKEPGHESNNCPHPRTTESKSTPSNATTARVSAMFRLTAQLCV
ncbi:hypothetical protein EJ03DRAFT_77403 [Teratosphaeria nubilosa]|uniref:CCHC-type domain-containing protein n=1 Tax=Teratosphaeria nubilosa TaxID=161662 RepID=A0A6G1LCE2_9PEZI|nr:hypothetical protein EJ03DRAFT_77403 [Teratosphaeria nubilosa]